jgi:hypothetical protein
MPWPGAGREQTGSCRATGRGRPRDRAGAFVVTDFADIDQTTTTATIRADSQSVSLKERSYSPAVLIQSQVFTSSEGTVSQINSLYQVYDNSGKNPTGTFDLQFSAATDLSLVVFDIVTTPSTPAIQVEVSPDGVNYTAASQIAQNGASITAYLPSLSIRYLRISITPSHPDNLGGYTFTFGITKISYFQTTYQLQSDFVTKPVTVATETANLILNYQTRPGVNVFLSLNGSPYSAAAAGSIIPVPGAIEVEGAAQSATLNSSGQLSWPNQSGTSITALPTNLYPDTLQILDANGNPVRLAFDLNPAAAIHLSTPVFAIWNGGLYYIPFSSPLTNAKFQVSYISGPASITAALRVQLVTRDRFQTPIFQGATLDNQ